MRWPAKVAAVALVLLTATSLIGTGIGSSEAQDQRPTSGASSTAVTESAPAKLPQICSKYLRERTEEEWDPIREEYWPPNHEWERCMNVGRK